MESFAFEAPTTLDAALTLLAERARDKRRTQILAGGTDMIVQMRNLDPEPRIIVDIKRIPETRAIRLDDDGLQVGAAVPGAELTARSDIQALYPGLVEAMDLIGSSQIQGRATLGGNLCTASPAGDTIPAMIVNDGVCVIASAGGTRELPVKDFVTGVQKNALEPGEMVVALRFPHPGPRSGDGYLRFIPRTEMDIAVASAGVRVQLAEDDTIAAARVAIGAVAVTALEVPDAAAALVGTDGGEDAMNALAAACSAAARPITDRRGTADYRRRVVGVLARRAAGSAITRARGDDQ